MEFPKLAKLKTADSFTHRLAELDVSMPFDAEVESGDSSPLGQPLTYGDQVIGNRFCILPMEGWDGDEQGRPTELTVRRWRNFGESGAKLIWGGEAVAVRHDGRANPNQLVMTEDNLAPIAELRNTLVDAHQERFSKTDDLFIGLQLTHSGRFARPNNKKTPEPRVAYRHPILDRRVGVADDGPVFSDDELDRLVDDFVIAAKRAQQAGFAFVDVKHCHGYLGHELLTAIDRPGRYGGDLEGCTRLLRTVTEGIRAEAPRLEIGVRLSLFDFLPFKPGDDGVGVPDGSGDYRYAFGGDGHGLGIDYGQPDRLLSLLEEWGIRLICTTAGSPYYNPHIQRPAAFPPSDGYQPPEDPLVGVARQINATAELKKRHPNAILIGSGYSYLQEWLPHVGQAVVRTAAADSIGLGRMVLSYPDLPADVLAGDVLKRKKVCRTFSDCTTAPRNGMVSGCYPLDPFYKDRPERAEVVKLARRRG